MKTKNTSDYWIAAAVIICSVVLLAALTIALMGLNFRAGGSIVKIDFPSAAGIRVNSEVRYAGKRVGVVKEISFLTQEQRLVHPENVVRVVARLDKDAPPLYQGTSAAIISDTVLAEKFVDLIPANLDTDQSSLPPKLGKQDVLMGKKVVGFDDLTRSGYQTIDALNNIMDKLKQNYPDIHDRIGSLVVHAEALSKNADELIAVLNDLVKTNDPQLKALIKNLPVITNNLKVITTHAKAFTSSIGEKPWSIIWGGEPNELPSEQEILQSDKPIPVPFEKKETTKPKIQQTTKGTKISHNNDSSL